MIEDLENIELNFLPVYDDKYIKTKIRTYGDKVCTNFHGLNVPENEKKKKKSFTVISIHYVLVYDNKYSSANIFRQLCL